MPLHLDEHRSKGTPNAHEVLDDIIFNLESRGIQIEYVLADGKERKALLGMKPTNSYFHCDVCYCRGTQVPDRKPVFP